MDLSHASMLIVDDEPMLREIFEQWFTKAGCRSVSTAEDGEEALVALQANHFDLLISDVRMPKMDGIALVRQLAECGGTIPSIIFVSGFGDVDEREMYGLGVEAFLAKPLRREELLLVINKALADRSALWREPMVIAPRQSITIEGGGFSQSPEDDLILLGQGGFSAHYTGSVSPGKVTFKCVSSSEQEQILGQGYVRWCSKSEQRIGIEFAYLEAPSRSMIVERIATDKPSSFIPSFYQRRARLSLAAQSLETPN
jgi:CheY-like chemotaxis protein